jgi:hypothetical protein
MEGLLFSVEIKTHLSLLTLLSSIIAEVDLANFNLILPFLLL